MLTRRVSYSDLVDLFLQVGGVVGFFAMAT